jgi:hypothetical protein
MRNKIMNMGLLTPLPGSRSPGNDLPALMVHEGMWVQAAFAVAIPEK